MIPICRTKGAGCQIASMLKSATQSAMSDQLMTGLDENMKAYLPGIISSKTPLKYSVSGNVGRTG